MWGKKDRKKQKIETGRQTNMDSKNKLFILFVSSVPFDFKCFGQNSLQHLKGSDLWVYGEFLVFWPHHSITLLKGQ